MNMYIYSHTQTHTQDLLERLISCGLANLTWLPSSSRIQSMRLDVLTGFQDKLKSQRCRLQCQCRNGLVSEGRASRQRGKPPPSMLLYRLRADRVWPTLKVSLPI